MDAPILEIPTLKWVRYSNNLNILLIFPQTFDSTTSVQNDVTLTNEELTLYNQLLLANNYQLDPRNPQVFY